MAGFIVRASVHPDKEFGPGEPDPGMEASEGLMGKPPSMGTKKSSQFSLPPSPKKKPRPPEAKPKVKVDMIAMKKPGGM